jgi:hypothetical protein
MNTPSFSSSMPRRQFGKTVAVGGAWLGLLGTLSNRVLANPPGRRLRIACVGAAGKGREIAALRA